MNYINRLMAYIFDQDSVLFFDTVVTYYFDDTCL